MDELSIETLMRAIGALVLQSDEVARRLEEVTPAIDASEHLSDELELIEQALAELGEVYERRRGSAAIYPPFPTLVERCRGL